MQRCSFEENFERPTTTPRKRRPDKSAAAKGGRLSGLVQNGARRCFDRFRQFNRSQNRRATAPTQNPTLDFRETGQFQTQLDAAVLQFGQSLRGMPAFFSDVISRQLVEANEHFKFAWSGEDAKTVAQPL